MTDVTLMQGFPPAAAGQVTLANWRQPPFNQWAFQHVRELVPSADIANEPRSVWALPEVPMDWSRWWLAEPGGHLSLEAWRDATDTDGMVVTQRGRIVGE